MTLDGQTPTMDDMEDLEKIRERLRSLLREALDGVGSPAQAAGSSRQVTRA